MTQQSDAPLAFVGAGVLGQAFAALLARAGRRVTLLGTPGSVERLRAAGHITLRGVVELDAPVAPAPASPGVVGITANPADLPAGAGLIFTTKGNQLPDAIDAIRAAWPAADDRAAWVAGMQNGMAKDDLLAAAFGPERVLGAATILGGSRGDDGAINVASLGMTYLGEPGGASARAGAAVATLRDAGIPATEPADIRSVMWSKACNAAGVFGVSTLARAGSGEIFRTPGLLLAYLALIRETAAIGAAEGTAVGDYPGFPPIASYVARPDAETLAAAAATPARPGPVNWPSMTQDLLAGRPLEVDGVFGDLVARAERLALPSPRLTLVRDLLHGVGVSRES